MLQDLLINGLHHGHYFYCYSAYAGTLTKVSASKSIVMYILVFHKEHKNADTMELNEHRTLAPELERHTGPELLRVPLYFHCLSIFPLQVCSDLQWGTRVTSSGLYKHRHYCTVENHKFPIQGTQFSPTCVSSQVDLIRFILQPKLDRAAKLQKSNNSKAHISNSWWSISSITVRVKTQELVYSASHYEGTELV